jgi:UDP-glucuronate 4-epimerase
MAIELKNKRIVVTGPTGQVAKLIALSLAKDNQVFGLARFSDADAKAELEAGGVQCLPVNLVAPDLSAVPQDIDYVLHFAVTKSGKWDKDLAANAEAVGHMMSHFRKAKAYLHCSSTAVYRPNGGQPHCETDDLGDHHKDMMPTYSISKIAAETMARFGAKHWNLPTVVARLNVPYGDEGGWPLFHAMMIAAETPIETNDDGSRYNPIHHEDIVRLLPALLEQASVPAVTINLAGNDIVSIAEWAAYLGEMLGKTPQITTAPNALPSAAIDTSLQHQLVGDCQISWKEGLRRMMKKTHPGLDL